MKIYRLLLFALLLSACKTQQFTMPLVIRDSVSVTYRQGKEQPASQDAIGAAHPSICVIDEGLPEIATGATSSELATTASPSSPPKGEGVKSKSVGHLFKSAGDLIPRNLRNSEASGRPLIRVDTVYIERWHSQTGGEAERRKGRRAEGILSASQPLGLSAPKLRTPDTIPRFYKNCTWGFWLLLLLLFGRIAFRIMKAIYLRK